MNDYSTFITTKLRLHQGRGIEPGIAQTEHLMPHQDALVQWALRKGRAAIFADTGLGKTRMQLVWADAIQRAVGADVLILAPLAVAEQTVEEGAKIGICVTHARDQSQCRPGINITNYDRLHRFDTHGFNAVVLDESSIIKHHDSKTLTILMDAFDHADYRLCATATPAPNDYTELGTHAQFLGICSRAEMLSEYFVHDGGKTQSWRLKGHAKPEYWRWVASWGAMIRSPADLGFDGSAYDLPPLDVQQITVETDAVALAGELFARDAQTLSERRQARRDSLRHRVDACAQMVNASEETWIIWCELNAEGDALKAAIPDAIEIRGADTTEHKERALSDFAHGRIRVLISKPKIAGFGLNWQHCARVAFIGVTDSFEAYYQAVRRCWRFGQTRPVHVFLYCSDQEGAVRDNLLRKEKDALAMLDSLSHETRAALLDEVIGNKRQHNIYQPAAPIELPSFLCSAVGNP